MQQERFYLQSVKIGNRKETRSNELGRSIKPINLLEDISKELNTKTYAIMIRKKEALNQLLDEQLKAGIIIESSSRYTMSCFYIPKKNKSL